MENKLDNKEELLLWIDDINDKIWKMRGSTLDFQSKPLETSQAILEKSRELNYTYGLGRSLLSTGMGAFMLQHDIVTAVQQLNDSINIFIQLDDKKWLANARLTLAIILNSTGQPETAMYNTLKGVDYYENAPGEDIDKSMAYYVTGTVFKDLKKYKEAELYYKKGLASYDVNSSSWGGRIFTSLANIYTEEGKLDEAIEMSLKGLTVLQAQKNIIGESRALNDIGNIYKRKKDYDKALYYYFEGLKLREQSSLKQFEFSSLTEIASLFKETGNTEKAIDYLKRAAQLSIEINQPAKEARMYQEIGLIYKSLGQFEKALTFTEKYVAISDELNQKEKEAKIDNLKDELLREKEQEIERLRNVELKEAYNLISEKNKEITDSIQYAKRIQKALMAPDYILNENLGEHFILYKPKDIVSGDFYWATSVDGAEPNQQLFYLGVCDSTGHGVPGAFMSLLNITYLNEAINEKKIYAPDKILNYVREKLINTISQDGARDGMDGILLCFNKQKNTITYSAANNGPIVKKSKGITLLPADKMPVGKDEKINSFCLHTIDVTKGDMIYLVTDGYVDQFGGPKGKKFKYKQLEETLTSISSLEVKQQNEILNQKFEEWKGALEQVDDVLVIGIKV